MSYRNHLKRARKHGFAGPTAAQRRDLEDLEAGRAAYRSKEAPGCKMVGLLESGEAALEFGLPDGVDARALGFKSALITEGVA